MDDEFSEYVTARYPHLLRVASLILGRDHEAAPDLVQEALARVLKRRQTAAVDNLDGMVRKTLTNLAISRSRTEAVRRRLLPRLADTTEHAGVDPTERDAVWRAVTKLPARQRSVLVLYYYEDMPYDEIASLLNISPVTARTQCLRARKSLRQQLEPLVEVHP